MSVMRTAVLFCFLLAIGCGGSGGPPLGPPAPVRDTIRVYTGRAAYFTTGPRLDQFDADGRLLAQTGFLEPTLPRNAPRIAVEVLDAIGALLGEAQTDDAGNYTVTINYGKNPAPAVSVRAVARLNIPGGSVVRVFADNFAAQPYGKASPLTPDAGAETVRTDITVALAEGAGAFHILDVLYEGLVAINGGASDPLRDLDIFWEPGNGTVSSFAVVAGDGQMTVAGGALGLPASNQDVWDAAVLMRLLGEYFLALFSNDVAPAGDADGFLVVPSKAWREGFLDFFSCIARNSRTFVDTEGIGASGRVVRYFDIESFFDAGLGSLGPDDPNVYQDPAVIGIGSRFTVAEVLWDIHDGGTGDDDSLTFPLFLTLRCLEGLKPGSSYPYLYSLFDDYVATLSITPVRLDIILEFPEDQGISYPASAMDGSLWPVKILSPGSTDDALIPPFDETFSGDVDALDPLQHPDIGLAVRRHFVVRLGVAATLTATITSGAGLRVEILDLENTLLAGGAGAATVPALTAGRYIIRVRPDGAPVQTPFDLRVQLVP